jgi:hypothetical protein
MKDVEAFLSETGEKILPRILTQICRDPGAPFYGACDRNWWHYKIRDFPSIIIQQAGYALHIASTLQQPASCLLPPAPSLQSLAAATARFWNQRAILHGAFEEYYPYEQGYPPVAFATLAVAKLCHQGVVPLADVRPGLAIAAGQLLTRFEAEAANQQIAGTAALAVIRTIDPSLIDEAAFQKILTRILSLQHQEGWFPEYDGPDLGYLAVSIDCLWDILDHTGDARVKASILSAADYTAWFALNPLGTAGMHNSRNTDYFVPYGLLRLAIEDSCAQTADIVRQLFTRQAAEIREQKTVAGDQRSEIRSQRSEAGDQKLESHLQSPISNLQSPFHPFDAVDDRYWCHYIGHSVFRALSLLKAHSPTFDSCHLSPASCPELAPATASTPVPSQMPGSGHALLSSRDGVSALVSTRKGAITTARWPGGANASDFGWIVQTPKQLFVSHWWTPAWTVKAGDTSASSEGYLVSHKEHLSAPWKHIVLRVGSFVMGRRLIRILKRLVIFKKPQQSIHFARSVSLEGDELVIHDKITGASNSDAITRAPRTSKRHVASADSYHPEDFEMLRGVERNERITRSQGVFECVSRYRTEGTGNRKQETGRNEDGSAIR